MVKPAKRVQARLHTALDPAALHPPLAYEKIEGWDDAKEGRAVLLFRRTRHEWGIPSSSKYLRLWKICLQYGGCTPFDIVGVKHGLRFKRQANNSTGGGNESSRVFSDVFSEQLSRLVTHPIWPKNHPSALADSLATTIQYVVKLRTND